MNSLYKSFKANLEETLKSVSDIEESKKIKLEIFEKQKELLQKKYEYKLSKSVQSKNEHLFKLNGIKETQWEKIEQLESELDDAIA